MLDLAWKRDTRFPIKDALKQIAIMRHMLAEPIFLPLNDHGEYELILGPEGVNEDKHTNHVRIIESLIGKDFVNNEEGFFVVLEPRKKDLEKIARRIKAKLKEEEKNILRFQQEMKEERKAQEQKEAATRNEINKIRAIIKKNPVFRPRKNTVYLPWNKNQRFSNSDVLKVISIVEGALKGPHFLPTDILALILAPLNSDPQQNNTQANVLYELLYKYGSFRQVDGVLAFRPYGGETKTKSRKIAREIISILKAEKEEVLATQDMLEKEFNASQKRVKVFKRDTSKQAKAKAKAEAEREALRQKHLEESAKVAEQYMSSFKRMGQDYYYMAKYVSEHLVNIKFDVEVSEFIQAAIAYGYEAVADYDDASAIPVSQYFSGFIRNKLVTMVADIWGVNRSSKNVDKIFDILKDIVEDDNQAGSNEFFLSEDEIFTQIKDKYPQALPILHKIKIGGTVSLDALKDRTSSALLEGEEYLARNRELKFEINSAVGTLTPREQKIIEMHRGLNGRKEMARGLIAENFSVSVARIQQIESAAIQKLRHPSRSRRLRPFLEPALLLHERLLIPKTTPRADLAQDKPIKNNFRTARRDKPLTPADEDKLWETVTLSKARLSQAQIEILPYILKRQAVDQIAETTGKELSYIQEERRKALQVLRFLFTCGVLREFGSQGQIIEALIRLTSEKPLERLFRHAGIDELLKISGDSEGVVELIAQMYPGVYREQDVRSLAEGHFASISKNLPKYNQSPKKVLKTVHHVVNNLPKTGQKERTRKLILKRLVREQYYQTIKAVPTEGLEALKMEIDATSDAVWHSLLVDAYEYYRQAVEFQPRGFKEQTEYGNEPLLPAQRFAIWESVQTLMDPRFESTANVSEARTGKTIVETLAAFNIRDPKTGDYMVHRLLYTTTNAAKYEVEEELRRRTDLDLHIIVIEKGNRKQKIQEAIDLAQDKTKNIVLIANYESVRDHSDLINAFAPDAHIPDEFENLKGGDDTVRAPIILDNVPAKYRIAISARPVINDKNDIIEMLLWTRHHRYLPPGKNKKQARAELEALDEDALFEALDPIKVRWRRSTIMPEVKKPKKFIKYVQYSPEQEDVIRKILNGDLKIEGWKDHIFTRYELARRASVDLGLIFPEKEKVPGEFMDASPKIQELDRQIAAEIEQNGRAIVLIDFVDEIERLETRYNDPTRYGPGAAVGISYKVPAKERKQLINQIRSDENGPKILFGTTDMIGSSLNLFQRPGTSFHISRMVNLSPAWVNVDAIERLVGIGQTHQVIEVSLVGRSSDPANKTIDQMVQDVLVEKKKIFKNIVDGKPIMDAKAREKLKEMAVKMGLPLPEEEDSLERAPDSAMSVQKNGGIDLAASNMKMNVQRHGGVTAGKRYDIKSIDGFTFRIQNIVGVPNLPVFLGIE